ncbi:MAG: DUF4270 domain-containing protein [Muribaculaceae bacterium]|nr:DUF4270 domain-containing protein [Muribaculaceae bacterium]MDE7143100.1 DUF4270 domain-containing protein [Muribaculaceae bacterium]
MRYLASLAPAAAALIALTGCKDTSEDIGSSLVTDKSEVVIEDSFTVTGRVVDNTKVQSRTITEILGTIQADGYGRFSSDFVTQFMPAQNIASSEVTVDDIDSLNLVLTMPLGAFVGDSVAPMGLEVFRLTKQLPYPIYSDFDPEAEQCFDPSKPIASKIYAVNAMGQTDSVQALSYRQVNVRLPLSLGKELFTLYRENPSAYSSPTAFAEHFPGIYVRNSYGSGRVTRFESVVMRMHYHTMGTDDDGKEVEVPQSGTYYAVTPVVVTNNNISYTMAESLKARIDGGEAVIVAPAGRDVELTFPLLDVIESYRDRSDGMAVINSLSMVIPAEEIENDYDIAPPSQLLMLLSKDKDKFFANNEITDDVTSFVAAYSSTDNSYTFSGLRPYLLRMLDEYEKNGAVDAEDYTFTLTPVTVSTETTSSGYYSTTTYISSITPYVLTPVMVKLDLEETKLTFTFTKQTVN